MRIVCKEQHTAEWMAARTGICTASRMKDAGAKLSRASKNGTKGDWAGSHWKYVSELAWEQITGTCADHYVSKPMDVGTQYEGEARVEYWQRFGIEPDETGFVLHPTFSYLGSSPDGLCGLDGGVEIKVPVFHNHTAYLEADEVPEEYQPQMYTNMLCCEREWWDFISYCPPDIAPELPDEFRMFRKRLFADPAKFAEIEEAATITMEHVVQKVKELHERYPAIERRQIHVPEPTAQQAYDAAMAVLDRQEMVP